MNYEDQVQHWESWSRGETRCPYCIDLSWKDYEFLCDCFQFDRERSELNQLKETQEAVRMHLLRAIEHTNWPAVEALCKAIEALNGDWTETVLNSCPGCEECAPADFDTKFGGISALYEPELEPGMRVRITDSVRESSTVSPGAFGTLVPDRDKFGAPLPWAIWMDESYSHGKLYYPELYEFEILAFPYSPFD